MLGFKGCVYPEENMFRGVNSRSNTVCETMMERINCLNCKPSVMLSQATYCDIDTVEDLATVIRALSLEQQDALFADTSLSASHFARGV